MGLKIHSIAELPAEATRGYCIYLLDYGWEEPLGRSLRENFDRMAEVASRHNAVVLLGLGNELNDELLSRHSVNGKDANDLLPAILITNKHPRHFMSMRGSWDQQSDHLVITPLLDHCRTLTDVAKLIDRIFRDIKAGKPLASFSVEREDRAGIKGALLDAVILEPTCGGGCWN